MFTVRTLPEFDSWLEGLEDKSAQRRLVLRLRRATLGNLGDVRPVGNGVWEMREHFGPGWRLYFARRGLQIILMVGGGDKSTQSKDIRLAHLRAGSIAEGG